MFAENLGTEEANTLTAMVFTQLLKNIPVSAPEGSVGDRSYTLCAIRGYPAKRALSAMRKHGR